MAYDRHWADGVVGQFKREHWDACELVRKLYGFHMDYEVNLLRVSGERWRGYKSLVKHVEQCYELYKKGYSQWM